MLDEDDGGGRPAGEYVKLPVKQYPPRSERETPEGKFWRSFRATSSTPQQQHVGPVTCIDFCPTKPYNFAITSSTRVILYDGATCQQKRIFSRFRDIAYSGTLRSDGRLLVAGGETGIVQVFDATSRTVLRQLKGHSGAVHFARYAADKMHVVSGGDDRSVRYWDVALQTATSVMKGHSDYVRCGAASPISNDLWVTGSYDHTVRLWDFRSKKAVLQLNVGHPVEALRFFSGGGLLAAAAGNSVGIWDLLGGGRLLQRLGSHQKSVTCLAMAPGPGGRGTEGRLLAGSADGALKVYELDSFQVTHAVRYPDPILSLGLSSDSSTLVVGMASGLLSVRQRRKSTALLDEDGVPLAGKRGKRRKGAAISATSLRYFLRGMNEKAAADAFLVTQRRPARLAPHDRLLRKFCYGEALTAALEVGRPEVVLAVVEELVARGGLRSALAGRGANFLETILAFVSKHVSNPRHAPLLVPAVNRLLDEYSGVLAGMSPGVDQQLALLRESVLVEMRLQEALLGIQGLLSPILQAAPPGGP
eukprot:TRINITY_DN7422_c0_g1_i1.p1 TRINITY_DN7422_c0_g1~~TRINITY_DN7422_c0_g1_i1.p1  ORF type:complete len:532 (+),score=114.97 TRINITY_DN7422_c0_g1_i1:490-2085(+)